MSSLSSAADNGPRSTSSATAFFVPPSACRSASSNKDTHNVIKNNNKASSCHRVQGGHSVDTSEDEDRNVAKNPLQRFYESNFGAEAQERKRIEAEMQELEDLRNTRIGYAGREGHNRTVVGGYDTCKEYSYSGEDDENDYFNDSTTAPSSSRLGSSRRTTTNCEDDEDVTVTYILGKTYHPIRNYALRRDDESSLFWFTYRCDFPEIHPYNITCDAGWGCMLRSAQMMLAQVLKLHYRSRDWKPPHLLAKRRQDPFVRSMLTWFADFPSSTENIYSLHNMVAAGLAKYDKLPGEWYGPGTACYVLRDLVEMHEKRQQQSSTTNKGTHGGSNSEGSNSSPINNNNDRRMFRVHVASEASVYRESIEQLMTRDSRNSARTNGGEDGHREQRQPKRQPAHPLDTAWEEELVESVDAPARWDTSLLLLIPLRLGLKGFNTDYIEVIAHTFSLPQSVGVLGGRPRGARYFYGALSDGSKVFGLDPHTVQNAPRKRSARVNRGDTPLPVVDLSDEYLRSVHTTYPEVFSLERMDPSIALGFYCRDRNDLEAIFDSLRQWKESHPSSPELFTVADVVPDYASNVSSAMDDMLMPSSNTPGAMSSAPGSSSLFDADCCSQCSDEDDYVML